MAAAASSEVKARTPMRGGRIVAIDVARGIALVAMTIYHFSWDLAFFGWIDAALVQARPWVLFARAIATSFLFLVGVSLVLGHGRGIRWRPFLLRLAQVVAAALAISLVTYLMDARTYVFFGILHAIALFSVLALAFLRLPWWFTLIAALAVWLVGNAWSADVFQPAYLLWIGLAPTPPASNDFVPIFPFFAATLAGVAIARLAEKRMWFERLRSWRLGAGLERPPRHDRSSFAPLLSGSPADPVRAALRCRLRDGRPRHDRARRTPVDGRVSAGTGRTVLHRVRRLRQRGRATRGVSRRIGE